MRQLIKKNHFEFKINTAFEAVVNNCSSIARKGMDGTWISEEIIQAYAELHHFGFAHSAEAWHDGKLAGGLYGVKLGNIFFGESMFSKESNASKFAFIRLVEFLSAQG